MTTGMTINEKPHKYDLHTRGDVADVSPSMPRHGMLLGVGKASIMRCVLFLSFTAIATCLRGAETTKVTFINSLTNQKVGEYEYQQYASYSEARFWNLSKVIHGITPYGDEKVGWIDAKTGKYVHDYDMVDGTVTELKSAAWPIQQGRRYVDLRCTSEIMLVPKGGESIASIEDPMVVSVSSFPNTEVFKRNDSLWNSTSLYSLLLDYHVSDIGWDPYKLNDNISQSSLVREIIGVAVWFRVYVDDMYYYDENGDKKWDPGAYNCYINLVMQAPNGVFTRKRLCSVNFTESDVKDEHAFYIRHFIPIGDFGNYNIELGNDYEVKCEVVASDAGDNRPPDEYSANAMHLSPFVHSINVNVQSNDVAKGELTLSWKSGSKEEDLSDKTFSIWRSSGLVQDGREIRSEATMCIAPEVTGTNFTDTTFGIMPGTDMVRYWVVRRGSVRWKNDNRPKLDYSRGDYVDTRRRVCLSVGMDEFNEAIQKDEGHEHNADEAYLFAKLLKKGGGVISYVGTSVLTGRAATPAAVTNAFVSLANECNPGDIFFFYIATHGLPPSNTAPIFPFPTLGLYADPRDSYVPFRNGYFATKDMEILLRNANLKDKGVKFVGVVNACYSGDFVNAFAVREEYNNTAWIASSAAGRKAECSGLYSRFGVIFLNWGWERKEAKRDSVILRNGNTLSTGKQEDAQLSLFEIANYTGFFLDNHVSNDAAKKYEMSLQQMNTVNWGLLEHTDVVDKIDENHEFVMRSDFPNFAVSEDIRCMTFTPIVDKKDRDPRSCFVEAEFTTGNDEPRYLCYCPYPDDDKMLRHYLLFSRTQANYYNNVIGAKWKISQFVDKYNISWFVDPTGVFLDTQMQYNCRAWTISPAGWSPVSVTKTFTTMDASSRQWQQFINNQLAYFDSEIISESIEDFTSSGVRGVARKNTEDHDIASIILTSHKFANGVFGEGLEFNALVVDSNGEEYSYSSVYVDSVMQGMQGIVYESSMKLDENGVPTLELHFPSSFDDLGDLNVTLKGMEMYGTIGACSFVGFGFACENGFLGKLDFDFDEEFGEYVDFYHNATLLPDDYVFEPELTVSPPVITEDDLIFTIKLAKALGQKPYDEITVRYGEKYFDKLPIPTRSGYRFEGWCSAISGTLITPDTIAVASGTLYASWDFDDPGGGGEPFTYECEVTFDANGGTCSETNRIVETGKSIGALPTPTMSKYKFLGWFSEQDGGQKVSASTKVYWDTTFYAHWEYDGSVVVAAAVAEGCEAMGKVTGGNATFKAGAKVSLKATANKGYVFVGWRDAASSAEAPCLSLAASFTYISTGEPITIVAVFASTGDDAESLTVKVPDDVPTEADGSLSLNLGECVESLSQPKLAVSGLPAGLKYDAKTGVISGKATKPGVYVVKVTATNASATGKSAVVKEFTVTVPNLTSGLFTAAGLKDSYLLQAGIAPDLKDVVSAVTGGGWKLAVSGLPSGVKYDAKKGEFTGIASKEGFSTVYFTATRGSGKGAEKQIATATFEVVFPTVALSMAAWDDTSATNKCKVAGGGKYPFGKKVTIKATPDKGKVFMGWYDGEGELVAQTASYSYVTTAEDVTFTAMFVTAEEDKGSIALAVNGEEMEAAGAGRPPYRTNIWCGVYLEWPVAASALSEAKVKVAGLPAGLKFTDKPVTSKVGTGRNAVTVTNVLANTIYGAPTAASKIDAKTKAVKPSEVKVTVTTAGKSSQVYQIDTTVDPLPTWAVGTFDGSVSEGEEPVGIVQAFTVAANGKISGKVLESGKTWALSASEFSRVEREEHVEDGLLFAATVIGKAGKEVVTNEVAVTSAVVDEIEVGVASSDDWTGYQNLWKRTDTKAEMPIFKKNFDRTLELDEPGDVNNTVKLTFKKDGVVSFAGKIGGVSVSGSSQLVNDGDGWKVTLYAPPKPTAKPPFEGFCETFAVTLTKDDMNVVTNVVVKSY